jgi:2-C-methyl-D-erythritol 4-phosphate cytidylyltransferase/2-C-methyl-D-erythritol 2,4-cyclodiphosphate synthase
MSDRGLTICSARMKYAVLIAAGGLGSRMNAGTNKLMMPLCGKPVLARTLAVFDGIPGVRQIAVVLHPALIETVEKMLPEWGITTPVTLVAGGATRQESVYIGLRALPEDTEIVAIHDGARPLVTRDIVQRTLDAAQEHGAAAAGIPVRDTLKRVGAENRIEATLDRNGLWQVQTPQVFRYDRILDAHRQAATNGWECTDDASIIERMGGKVVMVAGSPRNIKITTPEDLDMAQRLLSQTIRIGTGYDAHRLAEGRTLILGGVAIPYERGLLGHSDADVLTHAIIDAILGAAGLGDIGQWFPDDDPAYAGACSLDLLKEVADAVARAGCGITHIDGTIIAEAPKLAKYIPGMRANIAKALDVEESCVNIKATTTEGMGFTGRGEGIAAQAAATLYARD